MANAFARAFGFVRSYFLGYDPTLSACIIPFSIIAIALFTRHPGRTNFIFDEQEALLANPYVRSVADAVPKLGWLDAFRRDFWGLPHTRSIGSYRPLPDLVWRALWKLGARDQSPFLHHWVNIVLHALNASLLTLIVFHVTKRRGLSYLAGFFFVSSAIITEAVSGVVGIADVLGTLGLLSAVVALRLPIWAAPFGVALGTLFGLFSKESALAAVPLLPAAALLGAKFTHPKRPLSMLRAVGALVGSLGAFVFYVELRRKYFPAAIDSKIHAMEGKTAVQQLFWAASNMITDGITTSHWRASFHALSNAFLRWYAQPALPHDSLNNPLADAEPFYRILGGLRVYARGMLQVVAPWPLSGDYSAPQEPVPAHFVAPEGGGALRTALALVRQYPASVVGFFGFLIPFVLAPILAAAEFFRRFFPGSQKGTSWTTRVLVSMSLLWIAVSYYPVSNIPIALPTVRAERFWYFPIVGTATLLALGFSWLWRNAQSALDRSLVAGGLLAYFAVQGIAARRHANDYTDDLIFWDATRKAVPRSAKAHLNYSVMLGARGNLEGRLISSRVALELADKWPMASIYLGDTLCRLHRSTEAMPHYARGFELNPDDQHLVALAVQCLWDEKAMEEGSEIRQTLLELAERFPSNWVGVIIQDAIANGEKNKGVDPKYRPRNYNGGPQTD
ncbi:MAG: tetratricopeptide repeat protein [Polyangiaceae bacterium]|nr:tetratricopeptide repeat protein [Polyangiaceae bacterium]